MRWITHAAMALLTLEIRINRTIYRIGDVSNDCSVFSVKHYLVNIAFIIYSFHFLNMETYQTNHTNYNTIHNCCIPGIFLETLPREW